MSRISTHTNSTIFRYSSRRFFDICTDSTFSQYSLGFYHFPVFTPILTFFGTRTDSTFSRYSPRFNSFLVLTLSQHFFRTGPDCFSVLARIQPFPGTRPDSTIFWYSHWFNHFFVLVRTVFRHSHDSTFCRYLPGFNNFPVLTLILPFFRIGFWQFFDTRTNSTFCWYSPGFNNVPILMLILPFFRIGSDNFSALARIPQMNHELHKNYSLGQCWCGNFSYEILPSQELNYLKPQTLILCRPQI